MKTIVREVPRDPEQGNRTGATATTAPTSQWNVWSGLSVSSEWEAEFWQVIMATLTQVPHQAPH